MISAIIFWGLVGGALAKSQHDFSQHPHIRRAETDFSSYPVAASSKRGLLHIINTEYHPGLNVAAEAPVWQRDSNDLTWYYNYTPQPTLNASYEFVPMAWGPLSLNNFTNYISSLKSSGANISHVLFFNEPDQFANGGSGVAASQAAALWKQYFEPLRAKYNVKLGGPATTGSPDGIKWLVDFFKACSTCNVDFIPFHWYGDAGDISGHVANLTKRFSQPLWVTEYAPPYRNQTSETLDWFINVTNFLDSTQAVERYSYWGAWRSRQTPPNFSKDESMLNNDGKLTRIGGWYLRQPVESAGHRTRNISGYWLILVVLVLWNFV
jgi:Glycosyl hydrolase catalytic core